MGVIVFICLIVYGVYRYLHSEKYLNKTITIKKNYIFKVNGSYILNNFAITNERQGRLKKLVKHLADGGMFTPFAGFTAKEAREVGGVPYISDSFTDIFTFIEEPKNEHDPNAIRVDIKDLGTIGYIEKSKNVEFKEIRDSGLIIKETHFIGGGKIKGENRTEPFTVEIHITTVKKETRLEKKKRMQAIENNTKNKK